MPTSISAIISSMSSKAPRCCKQGVLVSSCTSAEIIVIAINEHVHPVGIDIPEGVGTGNRCPSDGSRPDKAEGDRLISLCRCDS